MKYEYIDCGAQAGERYGAGGGERRDRELRRSPARVARGDSRVRGAAQHAEALVDSGATFFCLPAPLIAQLGLVFRRERETRTIHGPCMLRIFGIATIEVEGRSCDVEVMELPEGRQALLGQVPLETLDFWVDKTNRRLVGNPEHHRQWMAEVY